MKDKLFSSPVFVLFFIVLTPFIVGMFLNFEFVDWGILAITALWMFVLFFPYYFYPKKWLFVLLVVLPFLMGIVDLSHWIVLSGPMSVVNIFILFETNAAEAGDFLSTYLSFSYVASMLAYISFGIFLIVKVKFEKRTKKTNIFVGVGLLFFTIIFVQKASIPRFDLAFPSIPIAIYTYFEEVESFRKEAGNRDVKLQDLKVSSTNEDEVFVLIIGESLNRGHMSLYGYNRETTPRLQAMSDELIVYNDVISASTNTLSSLKLVLTTANNQNNQLYYKAFSLMDFAKKGGFDTYWISNQSPIGVFDNAVSALASTCDYFEFVNKTGVSSRALNLRSYDEKLLIPFEKVLKRKAKKKLIVLHMLGSHISYRKRYPESFEFFKTASDDSEKVETINYYDNSVRYTDYFVTSVINGLKKYSKNKVKSSLLFFSDHGEDVYDEGESIGHNVYRMSRFQLEIPFIVWNSPKFIEDQREQVDYMKSTTSRKYYCDDVIHGITDLMGLESELLDKTKSPFDSTFLFKKRVMHKIDYDVILKEQ